MKTNVIHCGECAEVMAQQIPDESIDLTVTSPPYDNLRDYKGYTFDFDAIAAQLWRVTKQGGVVVWVVADQTKDGSESLTSFRQVLHFNDIGFNVHDTMIYEVAGTGAKGSNKSYWQAFEYMFVLSKDSIETVNRIRDVENKRPGVRVNRGAKSLSVGLRLGEYVVGDTGIRTNVWRFHSGNNGESSTPHPARFPENLARDHIISWSNPGDVVLDPMVGSGTVPKMSVLTDRQYIGIDVSSEYCDLARERVARAERQPALLGYGDTDANADKPEQSPLFDIDSQQ